MNSFYLIKNMSRSLSLRHLSISQDKEKLELYVELIIQIIVLFWKDWRRMP